MLVFVSRHRSLGDLDFISWRVNRSIFLRRWFWEGKNRTGNLICRTGESRVLEFLPAEARVSPVPDSPVPFVFGALAPSRPQIPDNAENNDAEYDARHPGP